jgi:hypothetical protein
MMWRKLTREKVVTWDQMEVNELSLPITIRDNLGT